MTPTICQIKHDPPESYGDCLRACIASVLDLPPTEVPHFADHDGDLYESIRRIRDWYKGGVFIAQYSNQMDQFALLSLLGELNPGVHMLLVGESHVVVCKDGKVVHDPAWYRKQRLDVPGDMWTVLVLTSV